MPGPGNAGLKPTARCNCIGKVHLEIPTEAEDYRKTRRGGGHSLSYSSQLTESKRQKGFLLFKLSILQKMLWIECVWCSLLFGVPMQCSQIGEYHCSLEKEGKSQCFMQGTHSCRSIVSLASMPGPAHILNSPRLHYLHSSTPMDSTFCVGQLRMVIGSTYWEFCQGS
jgi:hypothetical protein